MACLFVGWSAGGNKNLKKEHIQRKELIKTPNASLGLTALINKNNIQCFSQTKLKTYMICLNKGIWDYGDLKESNLHDFLHKNTIFLIETSFMLCKVCSC